MAWAQRERSIAALTLIGSRVRDSAEPGSADQHSDWDFQVVTSHPARFDDADWLAAAGLGRPVAYAARMGRLGSARKITILFDEGEIDLVVIPAAALRMARWLLRAGLARRIPGVARGLADLAVVVRAGFRLVKGERAWSAFFREVATQLPPARLGDAEVRAIAEGFVCDYVSTCRKIERGELLAAQRWLHHQLGEANFRLLHELRQRAGAATFPDARRLEALGETRWIDAVQIAALPGREALRAAAAKSAATFRALMRELVGETWRWPAAVD